MTKDAEKLVWEALEEARQRVKPDVKKEMEGEIIGQDILNFHMRGQEHNQRATVLQ